MTEHGALQGNAQRHRGLQQALRREGAGIARRKAAEAAPGVPGCLPLARPYFGASLDRILHAIHDWRWKLYDTRRWTGGGGGRQTDYWSKAFFRNDCRCTDCLAALTFVCAW
jgi:hypothetical protein